MKKITVGQVATIFADIGVIVGIVFLAVGLLFFSAHSWAQESAYFDTSDGARIFYRLDGSGEKPVIVVHGGPGMSMAYLRADMLELSKERSVVFYDQRGSGRSTLTTDASKLTVEQHIQDLDALIQHLGFDSVSLVGHSWGAGLAALYVLEHPRAVDNLVLIAPMEVRSTPYTAQFLEERDRRLGSQARERLTELSAAFAQEHDASVCHEYYDLAMREYFSDPAKFSMLRGDFCADSPEALFNASIVESAVLEALGDWDWRPSLQEVSARTLVVYGVDDVIPIESAEEWAENLSNGRLLVLQDSGHFPFVERPAAFFRAVNEFLDGKWPANSRVARSGPRNQEALSQPTPDVGP
jgi:proline iminopeptidase